MTRGILGEGARFLTGGAANTALTYALYLFLLQFVDYLLAYSVAYATGIILAYFLSMRYVFRASHHRKTMLLFPLIYVVQYALGAGVLHITVSFIGLARELALLASIAVTVPVTFLLSRQLFKCYRS
ncbi:MAG: GtrA family protein [Azoarcus sp.]|nr:GtrA family protein [Azoarcus sp.]